MRYVDLGVLPRTNLEKQKRRKKKILFIAGGLLVLAMIAAAGYIFYLPFSTLVSQLFKNPGIVFSFFKEPSGKLQSSDGKTNFLLLGIDKRESVPYTYQGPGGKLESNGFLSDTVILASVDLNTKQVSFISIPRDTWVSLPAWGSFPKSYGKINSAYSIGNTNEYPGGGLKLAQRIVSDHLGVPIHYGIRIDFEGFKKTIDTVDGVDIVVDKTFDDYQYPREGMERANCPGGGYYCRYEHIHFDAGSTHMNGETALKYVRSRTGTNGEGSDFARARRQQKVITATFKKATALGTIFDPVKVNRLFRDFGEIVEADIDLISTPPLIKLAREINIDGAKTFVLDPSSGLMTVGNPAAHGGAYAIVPKGNWASVQTKIKEFLAPPPQASDDLSNSR